MDSMARFWTRLLLGLVAVALGALAFKVNQTIPPVSSSEAAGIQVLVFTKTAGFRHGSIPEGIDLIETRGTALGWTVDQTEDGAQFNDSNLANYDVVVWLSTTGNVLNNDQQAAFERYIQAGGGYVGIHAATDTEYDWAWYGDLVGAYFKSHPSQQSADVLREDDSHPSSDFWPNRLEVFDEWYNFESNPRGTVNVLLTLDESTYNPGNNAMGADHPISWYHVYDGGRSWYTAMGHRDDLYTGTSESQVAFQDHVIEGIIWAAGGSTAPTSTPTAEPTASATPTQTPFPTIPSDFFLTQTPVASEYLPNITKP